MRLIQEEYQNEEQSQEDGDSQDQFQNHSDHDQHVAGNGANGSGPTGEEDSDEPEQFRKLFIGGLVNWLSQAVGAAPVTLLSF